MPADRHFWSIGKLSTAFALRTLRLDICTVAVSVANQLNLAKEY